MIRPAGENVPCIGVLLLLCGSAGAALHSAVVISVASSTCALWGEAAQHGSRGCALRDIPQAVAVAASCYASVGAQPPGQLRHFAGY